MASSQSYTLALVAVLSLGACDRTIEARPTRLLSTAELSSALPPRFEEDEGTEGKLIGVVIAVDGHNLKRFAGGGRNPIVRFVSCRGGKGLGTSFGPFIGNDFAQIYVREHTVKDTATYLLVATAPPSTLRSQDVCVELESRWYTGVVAKSARLSLAPQS